MKNRPISEFMSPDPHCIGIDQPLAKAHEMMREHTIRHLPVLRGSRVVGILSQRDLHLIETLSDVDPKTVTVEEAMAPEPFCVEPSQALGEIAGQMAERKIGAAVVLDGSRVAGVFTTVDALRALQTLLR